MSTMCQDVLRDKCAICITGVHAADVCCISSQFRGSRWFAQLAEQLSLDTLRMQETLSWDSKTDAWSDWRWKPVVCLSLNFSECFIHPGTSSVTKISKEWYVRKLQCSMRIFMKLFFFFFPHYCTLGGGTLEQWTCCDFFTNVLDTFAVICCLPFVLCKSAPIYHSAEMSNRAVNAFLLARVTKWSAGYACTWLRGSKVKSGLWSWKSELASTCCDHCEHQLHSLWQRWSSYSPSKGA